MLKGTISRIWPSQKGLPCSNGSKSILTWTPIQPSISPVTLSANGSPSRLTPPVLAIVAGNMQCLWLRILGATWKELCICLYVHETEERMMMVHFDEAAMEEADNLVTNLENGLV
jgi:hypothetical protein